MWFIFFVIVVAGSVIVVYLLFFFNLHLFQHCPISDLFHHNSDQISAYLLGDNESTMLHSRKGFMVWHQFVKKIQHYYPPSLQDTQMLLCRLYKGTLLRSDEKKKTPHNHRHVIIATSNFISTIIHCCLFLFIFSIFSHQSHYWCSMVLIFCRNFYIYVLYLQPFKYWMFKLNKFDFIS